MTEAYPLQWPAGKPRTATRKRAAFSKAGSRGWDRDRLTVADALSRLQDEIDRLGARQYVVSSNVETRLDGRPRSGQPEPADPGVALYFQLNGKPHCLPCDTFDRVADNIAAIAKHIEATRAIERYGVANMAEMFAGFTALPAPAGKRTWRQVLGIEHNGPVDRVVIDALYRNRAAECHPDKPGGSNEAMAELNAARTEALKEIAS